MKRSWQLAFGLALGLCLRLILPGHHALGLAATAIASLAGAAIGTGLAGFLLPRGLVRQGGFLVSGIGAIAAMLIAAIVAE